MQTQTIMMDLLKKFHISWRVVLSTEQWCCPFRGHSIITPSLGVDPIWNVCFRCNSVFKVCSPHKFSVKSPIFAFFGHVNRSDSVIFFLIILTRLLNCWCSNSLHWWFPTKSNAVEMGQPPLSQISIGRRILIWV